MMVEKCNKRYEVIFVMKKEKGLLWSGSPFGNIGFDFLL